jgi:lipopolysaccharide/colanic/teichoic acid biosynthesis glycosyltransferase
MAERGRKFPLLSSRAVLPLELGPAEAAAAYLRRFLSLMLAASVALTFVGIYVAIYKLGVRSVPLLTGVASGVVLSLILALLEGKYAARYSRLPLRSLRLPQAVRYLIERFLALLILLLFAPSFLVIALLVRLDSKGPIFVRRVKVGRFGRPFSRLTFRTVRAMYDEYDENNPQTKAKAVWKVTRVGSVLRRFSLDELPTLINVVKGEMTLFGEPPQAPDDLLAAGAFYLPRLTQRPGVVRVQHETDWLSNVPPKLSDVATYLRQAITDHRHEDNSKVFLLQVRHTETGPEGAFVLTVWVAGANEPEIRSHLKELGVSNIDVIAGSAEQTAALIEAAWTAWCDLPHRQADESLRQLQQQPMSGSGLDRRETRSK